MKEKNLSFIYKVLKNIKNSTFHFNKKSKQIVIDTDNSRPSLPIFFLTYLTKKKNDLLILPSNFDPEAHLAKFPPYLNGFPKNTTFNIEKMNVILGLLTEIPSNYKDLVDEDGLVPIYTPIVQSHFKDYPKYFDYLLQTDVIRSNFQYFKGERSTGWAWSRQFENQRFIAYRVSQDVDFKFNIEKNEVADYPYLFHWYETKLLRIDRDAALEFAWNEKERKMQDRSKWDINKNTNRLKYPISQYQAAIYNIYSCSSNNYKAHIDGNVHRLFSVLTNMQHELRNFVTYNNLTLVCIDIKNCNPYLACLIFNPEFWKTDSILPLNLSSLPNNIQDRLSIPSLSIMLGFFFNALHGGEFDEYIGLVSSGKIYETIMEILNETAETNIERDEAKTTLFSLIFSSNNNHFDDRGIRKFYIDRFPAVFKLFTLIKRNFRIEGEEKPHARLSCLLQSIESEIILHRCCRRIWEEMDCQIPIFTIHDSIVTTKGNEGYVHSIMMDELYKNIGVEPTLSVEYWGY